LRRAVENSPWDIRRITISVGIAEVTEQNTESIDVYQAADKALYRAKESGRNQVAQ
jgi:diguanylate cyclase (GGDEF)-like protein